MGDVQQRVSNTGVLTAVSLGLIVAFAVLVVLGILWGARLKRQRTVAEREEEARVGEDKPQPPASDDPAAESVNDQRSVPPTEGGGYDRSPATASARPDAVAQPEPSSEPAATQSYVGDRPAQVAPPPTAPAPAPPPLADAPAVAASPAAATVPAADGAVTQLKGLGPKVATRLAELGITTVGQIAALDAGEADRLDAQLGAFAGRLSRDRWIEQARFLAAGDRRGFEAVFGRL